MKFSIKDFFSKCEEICFLRILSDLLKKTLMENFIFCAVWLLSNQFRIINNYFFPLFSYPLTRGTCAYQGVTNARFFSGKFEVLYFLVTSVLRFARLPYYRRSTFLLLQWWYWRFRKHLTFWKSNNNLKANIETGGNEKTANFTKAPKYLFCDFLIFELIYSSSSEDFNKFAYPWSKQFFQLGISIFRC